MRLTEGIVVDSGLTFWQVAIFRITPRSTEAK